MAKIISFGSNPKVGKDNIFISLWESFHSLNFFVRVYILTGILIVASTPFIVANIQTITQHAQVAACTKTHSGNVSLSRLDVSANETVCFDPNTNTTMELSGNAVVRGTLRMRPANAGIIHTLRFINIDESKYVGGDTMSPLDTDVGLWIIEGGIWDVQGAEKTAWLRASGSLTKGSSQITLESTPSGWRAGDELVFAPTVPPSVTNHYDAYDYPKVVSVNGSVVTLDRALTFDHPAVTVAPGKTMTAEILNMTRNVRVEGQPGKRAHIIINHVAKPQTIRYVELRYLGPQRAINGDGDVPRVLGRYGLHFHFNYDGSRGSLIEGVTGRDMGNWMFVPHASHGTTWRNVIGHNGYRAIFTWDDKDENASHDTLWESVVASRVTVIATFRGYRINGFSLNKGDRNRFIDSAVFGVQGNTDASGVFWPEIGQPAPQWDLVKNISHNQKVDGWFAWENSGRTHVIGEGSVIYHNGEFGIDQGAYRNRYQFQGITIYGNGEAPIQLQAVSHGPPLMYFERMVIDASGRPFAVQGAHHTLAPGGYTTFFGEGCVFRGYTKAAVAQDRDSDGVAILIEVAPECKFEGTGAEAWIGDAAATGTRIRLLGLGIELTHKSLCSNPITRYNACVTPITVGPVQFDFNIDKTVSFMKIPQGGSATQSILAGYIRGPAQMATFSYKATGGLSGTTGTFSPTSCLPPCSTTLRVTTSASTKIESEVFNVIATAGSLSRGTEVDLVTLPPDTVLPTTVPSATPTPGGPTSTPTRTPTPTPTGDTIPPTTSISSPTANSVVAGTAAINASASDNVGVVKVEFYVDGTRKSTDTSSPYSYSWDTTNGGTHPCNGPHNHSITAKAYDAANNIGTSAVRTVNMNNPSYCSSTPTNTPTPTPHGDPCEAFGTCPTPTPSQLIGDFNKDNSVDLLDLNLWRDEYLGIFTTKLSDANKDGEVDILDSNLWRDAYLASQ